MIRKAEVYSSDYIWKNVIKIMVCLGRKNIMSLGLDLPYIKDELKRMGLDEWHYVCNNFINDDAPLLLRIQEELNKREENEYECYIRGHSAVGGYSDSFLIVDTFDSLIEGCQILYNRIVREAEEDKKKQEFEEYLDELEHTVRFNNDPRLEILRKNGRLKNCFMNIEVTSHPNVNPDEVDWSTF